MEELRIYLQSRITISSIIEILLIAFLIYKILIWMRGTQAEQVAKGLIVLLFLAPLSNWLGFTTLHYLIMNLFTFAFIIFVVVFQPELRSALEHLGNNKIFKQLIRRSGGGHIEQDIAEIKKAVAQLSRDHIGALIVCELNTGLNNIVDTGIELNSEISEELLENIFTPNRPLHDGAVIVKLWSNEIRAAGCLLPLSDNRDLGSELGTRHRAGLGISEKSDALTLIVSEETGTISYTERGQLTRNLTPDMVEALLIERFTEDDDENEKDRKIFKILRKKQNHEKKEDLDK